ncbi:class I SAM-dependent methyltransferase [Roseibium denhamense]|uniref:Methyltransferase domain-containing protein n=1 Tax=Roseibium denhamense TaxID=76305 RepID=A0ABY1PE60_9HYPH|nr:class I SAM-dependent methyltransferase [Roseibium denhamense]MTI06149.1 class I SAM-dependent methyltransferase [Roseibium denhamense]SMP32224.1 Methyltransferase domain-containing protein [Roseibium denhamense]
MHYYHDKENAAAYAEMCVGYDAAVQLGVLFNVLPDGAEVLELGSGPGNDMHLLASHYQVTGSDYSPAFVDMLTARFPDRTVMSLDAVTIAADGPFDAIYSNKVLHHLSDEQLAASFSRQADLLPSGGLVFHLVWCRLEAPEDDTELIFKARDEAALKQAMGSAFEILETHSFGEFDEGDSLAILAKKN